VDGSAEFSFWGKKYEAVEKGRGRYERENQGGGGRLTRGRAMRRR